LGSFTETVPAGIVETQREVFGKDRQQKAALHAVRSQSVEVNDTGVTSKIADIVQLKFEWAACGRGQRNFLVVEGEMRLSEDIRD
jgi:hypothetical protein